MTTTPALLSFVTAGYEAVTYLQDPSRILGKIDLGSADVTIVRDDQDMPVIVIMTSSGHAACLPAEVVAALR